MNFQPISNVAYKPVKHSFFDEYVSVYPQWLFATVNQDKVKMFFRETPFTMNEASRNVFLSVKEQKYLSKYVCLLRVHFKALEEAERFISDARECGIYVKSVFREKVPEGDNIEF